MHGLEHHLAAVQPLLERYGYGVVFLSIFVEGMGIPAPGQTLLIAASLLAAHGELSLGVLVVTAILASAAGNLVGFFIGRMGGRRILDRIGAGPRLQKVEDLFQRRGGLLVAFGRFVDGTRQLAALIAGSLGMAVPAFFLWNLLGSVVWASFWALGPYWFERDFTRFASVFRHARPFAIAVVVLLLALAVGWIIRGSQARARAARPS